MRRAQLSAIACTAALFYIFFSFKTASAILSTEWQRFSEGEQLVYIMGVADQLTMIAGHIRDNGGARTATGRLARSLWGRGAPRLGRGAPSVGGVGAMSGPPRD